jgi:hypothetical protein
MTEVHRGRRGLEMFVSLILAFGWKTSPNAIQKVYPSASDRLGEIGGERPPKSSPLRRALRAIGLARAGKTEIAGFAMSGVTTPMPSSLSSLFCRSDSNCLLLDNCGGRNVAFAESVGIMPSFDNNSNCCSCPHRKIQVPAILQRGRRGRLFNRTRQIGDGSTEILMLPGFARSACYRMSLFQKSFSAVLAVTSSWSGIASALRVRGETDLVSRGLKAVMRDRTGKGIQDEGTGLHGGSDRTRTRSLLCERLAIRPSFSSLIEKRSC